MHFRLSFLEFLFISISLILFSCKQFVASCYGINNEKYQINEIKRIAHEDGLDLDLLYYVDSSYYSLKKIDEYKFKRSGQPLQVLVIDSSDSLINNFVNCDFQGFPNINFNKYNSFDDSLFLRTNTFNNKWTFNIKDRIPFIRKLNINNKDCSSHRGDRLYVFYSNTMGRQKKRLFKIIKGISKNRSFNIYYINLDLFYNSIPS